MTEGRGKGPRKRTLKTHTGSQDFRLGSQNSEITESGVRSQESGFKDSGLRTQDSIRKSRHMYSSHVMKYP